jgi:hypothetical protein
MVLNKIRHLLSLIVMDSTDTMSAQSRFTADIFPPSIWGRFYETVSACI